MNVKRREQILVILAVSMFVLLAGDRFIVSPAIEAWEERSKKIETLKMNLTRGRQQLEYDQAYQRRYNEIRDRALGLEPTVAERYALEAIEDWKRASGVQITAQRSSVLEKKDETKKLEFRLSAQGDLRQITRFLFELETSSLALAIEDIQITSRKDNGNDIVADIRFTGLMMARQTEPPIAEQTASANDSDSGAEGGSDA